MLTASGDELEKAATNYDDPSTMLHGGNNIPMVNYDARFLTEIDASNLRMFSSE